MLVHEVAQFRKTLAVLVFISIVVLLFCGFSLSTRAILIQETYNRVVRQHDTSDITELLSSYTASLSFNCTFMPAQIAKVHHYFYFFGRSRVKVIMEVCDKKGWKWEFLPNNTMISQLKESSYTDSLYIIQDRSHIFYHSYIKEITGSRHVLVSAISEAHKVTGSKSSLLIYSRKLTKSFGCTIDDLKFIPKSFLSTVSKECAQFVIYATKKPKSMWLLKPYKGICGKGIKIYQNVSSLLRIINDVCGSQSDWRNQYIIQEYLPNLLLLNGRKFDVRAYILIARTSPYFVFYHSGYLRLTVTKFNKTGGRDVHLTNAHVQENIKGYSLEEHSWSFDKFQEYLNNVDSKNDNFVQRKLEPMIKQTTLFLLQAGLGTLERLPATYLLLGLDFMVTSDYHVWFIEVNNTPLWPIVNSYEMASDMLDLVIEIHSSPDEFINSQPGDKYGSWELVYNELLANCSGYQYNPCRDFPVQP